MALTFLESTKKNANTNPAVHFKAFDKTSEYNAWLAKIGCPDNRPALGKLAVALITKFSELSEDEQKAYLA